jgi:hypothetical protein
VLSREHAWTAGRAGGAQAAQKGAGGREWKSYRIRLVRG